MTFETILKYCLKITVYRYLIEPKLALTFFVYDFFSTLLILAIVFRDLQHIQLPLDQWITIGATFVIVRGIVTVVRIMAIYARMAIDIFVFEKEPHYFVEKK